MLKNNNNPEIDIDVNEFPDDVVKLITGLLDDKNYNKKHNSRIALVKMGKTIVPYMHKLLASGNVLLRTEIVKIVELIGDKRSIPFLINSLDDTEFDIRWIAAEGLIKTGRRSLLPLLKSIRDGKSSFILNKGARHVLLSLLYQNEKNKLMPLLLSLDDYHELGETAPVEASIAIKTLFKCKN